MSGYRQSSFDQNAGEPVNKPPKGRWWKIILFAFAWVVPSFWLMSEVRYPDSFGVHYQSSTGRGQTAEQFYYSYLLLERHHLLDVITFAWMWAPLVGIIGWIVYAQIQSPKTPKLPGYSDNGDLQL